MNQFNIISGKYKRLKFDFIGDKTLRPTQSRVRETLANWLKFELQNKTVLDCFAGSGALGFEALSAGAKKVVLVEKNPQSFNQIQKNITKLNAKNITLLAGDFFKQSLDNFDVVLLDPPFGKNLLTKSLDFLVENKIINSNSLIYFESENPLIDERFEVVKDKKTSNIFYGLRRLK